VPDDPTGARTQRAEDRHLPLATHRADQLQGGDVGAGHHEQEQGATEEGLEQGGGVSQYHLAQRPNEGPAVLVAVGMFARQPARHAVHVGLGGDEVGARA
jgi:hypothetical protein